MPVIKDMGVKVILRCSPPDDVLDMLESYVTNLEWLYP